MCEIKERLQNTSAECLKSYEAWDADRKDVKARGSLQEAIHELRKVTSRLEIELAINEREQMAQKPIPIPPHRASKPKGRHDADESSGGQSQQNSDHDGDQQNSGPKVQKIQRRRRKPASGGES